MRHYDLAHDRTLRFHTLENAVSRETPIPKGQPRASWHYEVFTRGVAREAISDNSRSTVWRRE